MNVWLIRDLEPIPGDPGDRRLMRAGMLSLALAGRGHATTWFTSSFDHYMKRQRTTRDETLAAAPNLSIELFRGLGYRRNIGLARILHNRDFARRWTQFAEASAERPDVLVTDVPTTEAAEAVVAFGTKNGVPVVLSIRDLWPDFFVDFLPGYLRPFARPLTTPLDRQVRFAAAHATSLIGISEGYLDWGRSKGDRQPNVLDRVFPLGYEIRSRPDAATVAATLQRLGIPQDRSIVGFVGSWGATYDLGLILETARRLAGRPDIVFVVAGDADTRPELRDEFRRLPNVVVPGWLEAAEIAALLSGTAIGLLTYVAKAPQGIPNKVFEYMAYGPYQVATLGGEITQFYSETNAGRVAGSDALGKAIVDSLPLGLDATARRDRMELFDRRFSAAKVYDAMVDHIEQVARR